MELVDLLLKMNSSNRWRKTFFMTCMPHGGSVLHLSLCRVENGSGMLATLISHLPGATFHEVILVRDSADKTVLHLLALDGLCDAIECILGGLSDRDKEELLFAQDQQRYSALHIAAFNGHGLFVKKLLSVTPTKRRSDIIKLKGNGDKTALHVACFKGHLTVVNSLLQSTVAVDDILCQIDSQCQTAFHIAAAAGQKDIVSLLLGYATSSARKQLLLHCDMNRLTPLHAAAANGHTVVIEMLIDVISSLNTTQSFMASWHNTQSTPSVLELAAGQKCPKSLKLILDWYQTEGLLSAKEVFLWRAIHEAASSTYDCGQIMQLLLPLSSLFNSCCHLTLYVDGEGCNALHISCANGSKQIVELLLGAVPKELHKELLLCRNKSGETALHLASENGSIPIIHLLMQSSNSDYRESLLFLTRRDGKTAVHMSAMHGHFEATELLITHANRREELLLMTDDYGWSALHYSAYHGKCSVSLFLLQQAQSPLSLEKTLFLPSTGLSTPLHCAVVSSQVEVVQELLNYPMSKDLKKRLLLAVDYYNRTAMFYAVTRSDTTTTRFLLHHHEACQERKLILSADSDKRTLLHHAVYCRRSKIVDVLLEKLRDSKVVCHKDSTGKTVLHIAAENGDVKIMSQLLTHMEKSTISDQLLFFEDQDHHTALQLAAMRGHAKIVERLVDSASSLVRDKLIVHSNHEGQTAVHYAAYYGYWDALCVLLNKTSLAQTGKHSYHYNTHHDMLHLFTHTSLGGFNLKPVTLDNFCSVNSI